MDIAKYRQRSSEQERIASLLSLIPERLVSALDIGARDGYLSCLLAERFQTVTALDLQEPRFTFNNVITVKGDVRRLDFMDDSFDVVLCAEVLEHIPTSFLQQVCDEISRVAKEFVVIGVPYEQDIRLGRTTCSYCHQKNPPWSHVNSFDEARLRELFRQLAPVSTAFVGKKREATNALSVFLMDLAGNPWGTYDQEETCVYCGKKLVPATPMNFWQRLCAKTAHLLNGMQSLFVSHSPNWIHMVFKK